jgi:hypothetical protein
MCDVCPELEILGIYESELSATAVELVGRLGKLKTLDMGYSDGDFGLLMLRRMLSRMRMFAY